MLDLPIKENEDEITTYCDIHDHFGEKWPYMKVVKANTDGKLSINGKNVKVISSYSYLDLSSNPQVT